MPDQDKPGRVPGDRKHNSVTRQRAGFGQPNSSERARSGLCLAGFENFGPVAQSVLTYILDRTDATLRHAELTAQAKSARELIGLQAVFVQGGVETAMSCRHEITELAWKTSMGRFVPFSAAQRQS